MTSFPFQSIASSLPKRIGHFFATEKHRFVRNPVRPEYPMGMRLVHKPQLRSRRASCTAWDAKSGNEEKRLVQIFSIKTFPKLKSCFSRINFSVPKKMLHKNLRIQNSPTKLKEFFVTQQQRGFEL